MDAHEVIKGIEHFFENLLPKAHNCGDWSEDDITNAFLWAQFCEQIYQTYKDKPTKNKLDELMHHMALFQNINKSLCFEDLNRSLYILYQTFSGNPAIEKERVKLKFLEIKGEKNDFEEFKDENELDSLCYELIEALKPIKIVNSDRSLYHEVKAQIYLDLLKDSTIHLTTEQQVETYLSDALEKLCENRSDNVLLLHVLAHRIPKEDALSSIAEIQEFAVNWTILKVFSEENCSLVHFLWKQISSLRAIAFNSTDFLTVYLDFITNCAASLICELEGNEMEWISSSLDRSKTLSFDEILSHFQSLLKYDDDVCESTKKYLLNLLDTQPDVPIFKEIFSRVT